MSHEEWKVKDQSNTNTSKQHCLCFAQLWQDPHTEFVLSGIEQTLYQLVVTGVENVEDLSVQTSLLSFVAISNLCCLASIGPFRMPYVPLSSCQGSNPSLFLPVTGVESIMSIALCPTFLSWHTRFSFLNIHFLQHPAHNPHFLLLCCLMGKEWFALLIFLL